VAIPIAVAPADASPYPHHASEDRTDQSEEVFDRDNCLYATAPGARLYRADIHHAPWPLQPATAVFEANTMVEAAGLRLPPTGPVLHFAQRLDVVAGPPRREAI
jgi:uncharacterized protein